MTGAESQLTVGVAMLAGMAYFFSPCVWPLYPAYLAYLGGTAAGAAASPRGTAAHTPGGRPTGSPASRNPGSPPPGTSPAETPGAPAGTGLWAIRMTRAAGFVLGLGLVFVSMGATLSAAGQLLAYYRPVLEKIAGVLIILFGLNMLGWLRWAALQREWHPAWRPGTAGFPASVAMGAAFGLGWTPCVGPVLGSILVLAGSAGTVTQGMLLLAAFTAGFAVPFLALAALIDRLEPGWLRRRGAALQRVQVASGAALVALGVLVFTGQLARLSFWLWELLS